MPLFPSLKLRGGSYWNKYKKPCVGNIDKHNISLFLKISLISRWKLSHFYALWLFNFLQNSNLYMKFMNKITETRYSFMYLIKNEKNIPESPKFGNGHIQLIRIEVHWANKGWSLVWVSLPNLLVKTFFFCKDFLSKQSWETKSTIKVLTSPHL